VAFDLKAWREKHKVSDEAAADIEAAITEAESKVAQARQESISGRKGLKEKLDGATARVAALEDWAGIEAGADLEGLPAPKGNADAVRQFEAKLRRAEREREDAIKARDELDGKYRTSRMQAAIGSALDGHDFIARDVAEMLVSRHAVWEGDELFYKSDDGKLMPLKDGAAVIAKTRPELLKSQGAGGAGFKGSSAGGGGAGGKAQMKRAEFETLDPAAKLKAASEMTIVD
jgi:hypothetical protein